MCVVMGIFYLARTFCVFVCLDLCAVCTMSLLRRQLRGFPPSWRVYRTRIGPFRASARGGAGESRVGSQKLRQQTSGLFIALSPAPPTAPSRKLCTYSAHVFLCAHSLFLQVRRLLAVIQNSRHGLPGYHSHRRCNAFPVLADGAAVRHHWASPVLW